MDFETQSQLETERFLSGGAAKKRGFLQRPKSLFITLSLIYVEGIK